MPNATHIQRIGRLARELAENNDTDVDTAIQGMSLSPWHEELAAIVADVPAESVRQFVAVHRALKSTNKKWRCDRRHPGVCTDLNCHNG